MTTTESYDKLWEEYNTGEIDDLLLTKINLCHKMIGMVSDEARKRLIQSELNIHFFYFTLHHYLENIDGFELNQIQQQIQNLRQLCDDKSISYYQKRFNETPSSLNKSRYALGIWFLTNDPQYLNESIQLILQTLDDPVKKPSDRIHFLATAFNLARIYNLKQFNSQISDLSIKFFYNFINNDAVGWVARAVVIFVQLNKIADYNLVNNMITNLHRTANQFFLKENYHSQQVLLEESISLCDLTNLDHFSKEVLKREIQGMIAESKEYDGHQRWKKGEAMGAVWCFEQAKENYEKSGGGGKITELLENIRKATQDIQWKEFKFEFKMPELKLDGKNGEELINSIYLYQEKIPNQDFICKEAQRQLQENPLLSAVSHTTFSKKNPISHATDDNELLQEKIKQLLTSNIRLGENRLSLAVRKLEDEKKITANDLLKFFEQSSILDSEQISILESGIENHFKEDYIASIHTLVPQIEGILRSVFEKKGISLLKTKRGNIMDTELGSILSKPETVQILGRDFANYLKIKYVDPTAINLRNEVSHALASISEFSYFNSLSLIHDLMILSRTF